MSDAPPPVPPLGSTYPAKAVLPAFAPTGQYMDPRKRPQRRNVTPLLALIGASLAMTVLLAPLQFHTQYVAHQEWTEDPFPSQPTGGPTLALQIGSYLNSGLGIAMFVLLAVWIYRAHRDVQILSHGIHRPKPGLALGLLFVPYFSGFWLWWMLCTMSRWASGEDPQGAQTGDRPPARPVGLGWAHAYCITMAVAMVLSIIYLVLMLHSMFARGPMGMLSKEFHLWTLIGTAVLTPLSVASVLFELLAIRAIGPAVGDRTEQEMARFHAQPFGASPLSQMPSAIPMAMPVKPMQPPDERNR